MECNNAINSLRLRMSNSKLFLLYFHILDITVIHYIILLEISTGMCAP